MEKIFTKLKTQSEQINNFKIENRLRILVISCSVFLVLNTILQKYFLIEYYEYTKLINVIIILIELLIIWQVLELIIFTFFSNSVMRVIHFFAKNKEISSFNEEVKAIEISEVNNRTWDSEQEKKYNELQLVTNTAIQYSQLVFGSYLSKKDLSCLCKNIIIYANNDDLKQLTPIAINTALLNYDIFHYGWNIWNHFYKNKYYPRRDQIVIAEFLKITFSEKLNDVEELKTIKSKLKAEPEKGSIKISEDLNEIITNTSNR